MTESLTQENATEYLTTIPGSRRERDRLVRRFPDFQRDVAKRLRLKATSAVNHVFHRRATSARIESAILAELNRRIDAEHNASPTGGNGA